MVVRERRIFDWANGLDVVGAGDLNSKFHCAVRVTLGRVAGRMTVGVHVQCDSHSRRLRSLSHGETADDRQPPDRLGSSIANPQPNQHRLAHATATNVKPQMHVNTAHRQSRQ